jgi:hypothetical protein
MNPGEYIGKDGGEYRWLYSDVMGWIVRDERGCVTGMKREDVTDAKAALDALIEAESVEWVEWTWAGGMYRASADGSRVQMWDYCLEKWVDATESRTGAAYRKGREVAQAEQADMRDAVWELVDNVRDLLIIIRGPWPPSARALECVEAVAKKVGAKL